MDQHEAVLEELQRRGDHFLPFSAIRGQRIHRFSSDSTQSNANLDGVEDQLGMRGRFVRTSINWSEDGKTLLTNHCLLKS